MEREVIKLSVNFNQKNKLSNEETDEREGVTISIYALVAPVLKCICCKFKVNRPTNEEVIRLLVNCNQKTAQQRRDERMGVRYNTDRN